jgi:hypothetical protein
MAMTENQFQALLTSLRAKYDQNAADAVEAYQAIKDGLASNTTGLTADQVAKIDAELKTIMGKPEPVFKAPKAPELTGARAVLREGQDEDFDDEHEPDFGDDFDKPADKP